MYNWKALDDNGKIQRAASMMQNAISKSLDVLVVVDPDQDGYGSSALFINYFYSRYPEYTSNHIDFIMHDGKVHGLSDICDEILSRKPALLISPDGGSNDKEQQEILNEAGIDIIVLDHHDVAQDYTNEHTVIVNVQLSDYPNKALTGAGVAYRFISAFEDLIIHCNQPMEFMDLCALGII